MLFGDRIKSERKRLGLTQAEAADACGISRGMWLRYEKDTASMGSEVMALFATVGADVFYILTGQHTPPPKELTPREAALLSNYRNSGEEAQRSLETTSALLAQSADVKDDTDKAAG